jgi:hypothetical protein
MITVNDAYKIAKRGIKDALVFCGDAGDRYVFYFDSGDGSPYITVNKHTMKRDFLPVPPLSNLDIVERAKEIDIATLTE